MITQLKSLVLSFGLIDKHLSVEQAVLLSRLEEEYQVLRLLCLDWLIMIDLCNFSYTTLFSLRSSTGEMWSGLMIMTCMSCGHEQLQVPCLYICLLKAQL